MFPRLWILWATLVRTLFRRAPRPPALASETAEWTEREEERALLRGAGRCVTCGVCDRQFTGWASAERDRFFGPMTFVLRCATSSAGWSELGPMVRAMERGDPEALQRACPVDVPFVSLVRAVRAKVPPPAPRPPKKKRVTHDPG
jgi:hypothetical protein